MVTYSELEERHGQCWVVSGPSERGGECGPFFRRHISQARWTFRFLDEGRTVDVPSPDSGNSSSADDMVAN